MCGRRGEGFRNLLRLGPRVDAPRPTYCVAKRILVWSIVGTVLKYDPVGIEYGTPV